MAKCLFQYGGGGKSKFKVVTAGANDVLKGKVIVDSNGNPLTGTIESMDGQTIAPSNTAKAVSCNGKYMTGDISAKGDANLVASNIINGKSIFGVAGNAQKLASTIFNRNPSGSKKTYQYWQNNYTSMYIMDLYLGFHPVVYGYTCSQSFYTAGMLDQFGTFRVRTSGNQFWDFIVNGDIVSGTNLFLPVERLTAVQGFVAGYY